MKTRRLIGGCGAGVLWLLTFSAQLSPASAASTIDAANRYAFGANIGWVDWRGDSAHGGVIGEYVCSGYLYAADVGWINLGGGSPTNGIRYKNQSLADFGVNHDGQGNLSGFAYGANIGWINFETNGAPKVNLKTGQLSGFIYSPNCGWISLSNAFAFVQTDTLSPGTLDTNGLPIAWELTYFGTTGIDPNADPDGDGMSNQQEYLAGTNPLDGNSALRLTAYNFLMGPAPANTLVWTSVPTRLYYLEQSTNVVPALWLDSGLGQLSADGVTTTRTIAGNHAATQFFRVRAVLPLAP